MKRRTFLSAAPLIILAAACRPSRKKIIGVAPKGTASVFWETVHAGVLAAGRDFDVEILWNGPARDTDFARQIQIVDAMINRRVDAIVLGPTEKTGLVRVVERAMDAGIPVTIIDSGIETDNYVSYIATDNTDSAGRMAADTLAKLLAGEGRVGLVSHVRGSASTDEREDAFKESVARKYKEIEIVAEQYCMSDRSRALAVAEDILTAHPDLDGMFASGEAAAIGAARAIRTRGLAGKVKMVGFDASPTLQDELRNGVIDALVVQDPFKIGYLGIQTIMRKLSGETPQKIIHSPARVITAADLEDPEVRKLLNPDLSGI